MNIWVFGTHGLVGISSLISRQNFEKSASSIQFAAQWVVGDQFCLSLPVVKLEWQNERSGGFRALKFGFLDSRGAHLNAQIVKTRAVARGRFYTIEPCPPTSMACIAPLWHVGMHIHVDRSLPYLQITHYIRQYLLYLQISVVSADIVVYRQIICKCRYICISVRQIICIGRYAKKLYRSYSSSLLFVSSPNIWDASGNRIGIGLERGRRGSIR